MTLKKYWSKWRNQQLEITQILNKITDDMYNREMWNPKWKKIDKYLCS